MKKDSLRLKKRLGLIMLAGLTFSLSGCFNDDYDLNEVDMTIGLVNGELQIPAGSTDKITLDDVLDLNADECVKKMDNGDYMFKQNGNVATSVNPCIDIITVASHQSMSYPFEINFAALLGGAMPAPNRASEEIAPITLTQDIQMFEYKADKPAEVEDLLKAEVNTDVSVVIPFDKLQALTPEIHELSILFPPYMELANIKASHYPMQNGSTITFKKVPTSQPLTINMKVKSLDFHKSEGNNILQINGNAVDVVGYVHMELTLNQIDKTAAAMAGTIHLNTEVSMESDFQILSATGRFNPSIEMHELGSATFSSVPDFLTREGVVVDIYNPTLILTINSDLNIESFARGTITAHKAGMTPVSVDVPEVTIWGGKRTVACICRVATDELKTRFGAENVYEVPTLSTLITTIPDEITFAASARANSEYVGEFVLGKEYTITPSYDVEAPLAFGKNAHIIYNDTVKEWNADIQDYQLTANSYVEVTANVTSTVPAFVKLSAKALDINGQVMSDSDVTVEIENTILAGSNENPATTPITIRIKQTNANTLKMLDGIVVEADASATYNGQSIVGTTLNAYKHFVTIDGANIKLVGCVIADLN